MSQPIKERNIHLDLPSGTLDARGYRGRIEFYGEPGNYPNYAGLSWRTFKFQEVDASIKDGALIELDEGKRTPVEIVKTAKVFSEVPLGGNLVFLHINTKGEITAYHFDSRRKKDSSFLFDVVQNEVFCWVALGKTTVQILEYEEPGFTNSDFDIIEPDGHNIWNLQIPEKFWKMVDQVQSGMTKDTVVPIVELSEL